MFSLNLSHFCLMLVPTLPPPCPRRVSILRCVVELSTIVGAAWQLSEKHPLGKRNFPPLMECAELIIVMKSNSFSALQACAHHSYAARARVEFRIACKCLALRLNATFKGSSVMAACQARRCLACCHPTFYEIWLNVKMGRNATSGWQHLCQKRFVKPVRRAYVRARLEIQTDIFDAPRRPASLCDRDIIWYGHG